VVQARESSRDRDRMKGIYKASNKMHVHGFADGRKFQFGPKLAFEAQVLDEHQRCVAHFEIRRQPDNEITLSVYGSGEDLLYEAVVKRGADRRRVERGTEPKERVRTDVGVAPDALGGKGRWAT